MNSTKTLLATALIAVCIISQPVLAADVTESATLPALNTLALESTDLNFAFEQTAQPVQMAALSEQEMKETEGAAVPLWAAWSVGNAGWGAVSGGVSYVTSTWASGGQYGVGGFIGSVVGGAAGGFFKNPGLAATVGSAVGGVIGGGFSRFNW